MPDHLQARARLRLIIEERLKATRPPIDATLALVSGRVLANDAALRPHLPASPIAAAVLVPIIEHSDAFTLLLTRRASHLKNHAGQISFPGGRIEADDDGPANAALREAYEEIGLAPEHVTIVGYLEPQLVLSGFWITPVVGFVRPGFDLRLDSREVDSTFEVPLVHILDPAQHRSRDRAIGETIVQVYEIVYGEHHIWGATAAILMSLYRTVAAR